MPPFFFFNATFLTQKWMFTYQLVITGPSHHRPRFEDKTAFSSGNGFLFPTVSASCRSPSLNIPPSTSRWAPVLDQSLSCGAPPSQHAHVQEVPQGMRWEFVVKSSFLRQAIRLFLQEMFWHNFFQDCFLKCLHLRHRDSFTKHGEKEEPVTKYECHIWHCNGTVYFPSIFMSVTFYQNAMQRHVKDLGLHTGSVV